MKLASEGITEQEGRAFRPGAKEGSTKQLRIWPLSPNLVPDHIQSPPMSPL